jgi:hypothetical protein
MVLEIKPLGKVEEELCGACGGSFRRIFGEVWRDERPGGMYSADLHREKGHPTAILAIGLLLPTTDAQFTVVSCTCDLWLSDAHEFQLGLRESAPSLSYYAGEIFGRMRSRSELLSDPLKEDFFHVSDHVCLGDTRLRSHFGFNDA